MATSTKPRARKSTSAGPRRTGKMGVTTAAKNSATDAKAAAASTPPENMTEDTTPMDDATATALDATETTDTEASGSEGAATEEDRLKRSDLIEAIAKRVSLKRSEAKMVFDVVLDEIGKALDASDEVVVPPLGKLMVKKRLERPGGDMLTMKLKRASEDPAAGDVAPLADPEEDS